MLFSGAEKDKEAHELKRAVDVMLALKDFEEKCSLPLPPPPPPLQHPGDRASTSRSLAGTTPAPPGS
jgi:hypothetical protein